MKFQIQTVAAAVATVGDRIANERSVNIMDADALGQVMKDAETMVSNEMARQGMSLQEAREMVSTAAVSAGRDTPESATLVTLAFQNRLNDVPEEQAVDNAPEHDVETPGSALEAAGDESVGDDADDSTPDDERNGETMVADRSTPAKAKGRVSIETFRAPSRQSEQRKLIPYNVVMKKVAAVFPGIDAGNPLFDFEIPILQWNEPHPGIPAVDSAYNMDVEHLLLMLYAVASKKSVNLVGPHGAGKTKLVEQVAARINFPVTTLPMDGQLTRSALIGQEKIRSIGGATESYFSEGLLPRALAEPGFILFDEIDRGVSDLQYACHSVYLQDGLRILEDDGRLVPFHLYNRVFATANTKGRGSMDGMYLAAEEMSEATRDRLSVWIEIDYQDEEDDINVLMKKVPGLKHTQAKTIAEIAGQIRSAFKGGNLSQTCSMRQQLDTADLAVFLTTREQDDDRKEKLLLMAFRKIIIGRASDEDRASIDLMLQAKIPGAFVGESVI